MYEGCRAKFYGKFDGNGHYIRGFYGRALFEKIENAEIKNLNISHSLFLVAGIAVYSDKADVYENKIIELKKELQKLEQNKRVEYEQTFETAKKEETENNTFDNLPKAEAITGKNTTIKNINTGDEIPLKYAFLDLDKIISSHGIDGKKNLKYNHSFQPRERTGNELFQAIDIAKNLEPSKLAESSDLATGSPITNSKGMVLSGNGRTQALNFARKYAEIEGRTEFKEYNNYLKQNAQSWGLKPEDVTRNSILVRIAPDEYAKQIAHDGNVSDIRKLSHSQQAKQDYSKLTQNKTVYKNFDDFYKNFIETLSKNERQTAIAGNEKGENDYTPDFKKRANNALIYYSYGQDVSKRLADTEQPNIVKLRLALLNSAIDMANARTKIGDNPLFDNIENGIMKYLDARVAGKENELTPEHQSLLDAENTLEKNIANFIYNNRKTENNIETFFKETAQYLSSKGSREQSENMFGETYKVNDEAVILGIIKDIDPKNKYSETISNTNRLTENKPEPVRAHPVESSDKDDESKLSVKEEQENKKFKEELEVIKDNDNNIIKNDNENQGENEFILNLPEKDIIGSFLPKGANYSATIGDIEFYHKKTGNFTAYFAKKDGKVYTIPQEKFELVQTYEHNRTRQKDDGYIKGDRKKDAQNKSIQQEFNEVALKNIPVIDEKFDEIKFNNEKGVEEIDEDFIFNGIKVKSGDTKEFELHGENEGLIIDVDNGYTAEGERIISLIDIDGDLKYITSKQALKLLEKDHNDAINALLSGTGATVAKTGAEKAGVKQLDVIDSVNKWIFPILTIYFTYRLFPVFGNFYIPSV